MVVKLKREPTAATRQSEGALRPSGDGELCRTCERLPRLPARVLSRKQQTQQRPPISIPGYVCMCGWRAFRLCVDQLISCVPQSSGPWHPSRQYRPIALRESLTVFAWGTSDVGVIAV